MELVSIHIGLFQLAHPSRMIHIFKAKLLLYTHCLLQFSIKKCIFDIQLLQFPPFSLDQSQHNPYCLRFDNRRKCFNIVNALHLITSLTYNPSLTYQANLHSSPSIYTTICYQWDQTHVYKGTSSYVSLASRVLNSFSIASLYSKISLTSA